MTQDRNGKTITKGNNVKRAKHLCKKEFEGYENKPMKVVEASGGTVYLEGAPNKGGWTAANFVLIEESTTDLPEEPKTNVQKKALELAKEEIDKEEANALKNIYKKALLELGKALETKEEIEEKVTRLTKALKVTKK